MSAETVSRSSSPVPVGTRRPPGGGRRRHPDDLVRVVLGTLGLAVVTLLAIAGDEVNTLERAMFQLFNALPDAVEPMLWLVMQLGSIAVVPVAVVVVLVWRRRGDIARDFVLAGVGGWLLSFVIKALIGRGRPGDLVLDAVLRGGHVGLGFPSGHATVAAALATVLAPHLPRVARRWAWGAVILVGFGRLYVGAHLPLDVVGGWLLGWSVGSAVLLLFGSPVGVPDLDRIRQLLREAGLAVDTVRFLDADARGSIPLVVTMDDDGRLFGKVLNSQHRSADMLFKLLRRLLYSRVEDETPFVSPKQQAEHELLLTMLANDAGVRTTPHVHTIADETTLAVVLQESIDGVGLDELVADGELSAVVLQDVLGQVALLHEARIAHRDLRPANVVVDDEQRAWLVDFGFAQTSASDRRRAWDVAELLGGLAPHVDVEQLVDAAAGVLGEDVLREALPMLTPPAFSSATRSALRDEDGLLDELREAVAVRVGLDADDHDDESLLRVRPRTLLLVVVVGLGLYVLFPQMSELPAAWNALLGADPLVLVGAVAFSMGTYLGAGLTLTGASPARLPYPRAIAAAVAGSFASRFAPAGLGRVGLDLRLMTRAGATRTEAVAGETMLSLTGGAVHVTATLLIAIRYGRDVVGNALPSGGTLLVGAVVLLAVAGVLSTRTEKGRALVGQAAEALESARASATDPRRMARLVGGAILINAMYIGALDMSVLAVGGEVEPGAVALVYLGGSVFTAVSPTPGGLGAVEAALVAGLTFVGVAPAPAVAGVLVFRLLTYWLPVLPGWFALRGLRRRGHL